MYPCNHIYKQAFQGRIYNVSFITHGLHLITFFIMHTASVTMEKWTAKPNQNVTETVVTDPGLLGESVLLLVMVVFKPEAGT